MKEVIKPGKFGAVIAADTARDRYDFYNAQIVNTGRFPDVVFAGDSLTEFCDLLTFYGDMGLLLANRGIGGDSAVYLLKRFEADMIQLRPKAAVILIGVNDIISVQDDLWWQLKGADPEKVLASNLECIAAMSEKAAVAGIKVILCSMYHIDLAIPFNNRLMNSLILRQNSAVEALCREQGYRFADIYPLFCEGSRFTIRDYAIDGIHPNFAGYELISALLRSILREVLR